MSISIRPAEMRDIPLLAHIVELAWSGYGDVMYADAVPGMTPRQIIELRLEMEDTTAHFSLGRVAELNGEPVGAIHAYPVDHEADDPIDPFIPSERYGYFQSFDGMTVAGSFYINAIGVLDNHRGEGIAAALMNSVLEEVEKRKFETISLFVFEQNQAAVSLYRRFGFEERMRRAPIAHPSLHYPGDVLVMVRA